MGELQSLFYKYLTECFQISLKNLSYLTDFSPQPMACMQSINVNAKHKLQKECQTALANYVKYHIRPNQLNL